MTLDDFIISKFDELEAFNLYWVKGNEENPKAFSAQLSAAEFNEQFQMWKDFVK